MTIKNRWDGFEIAVSVSVQAVDAESAHGARARELAPFRMWHYTIDGNLPLSGPARPAATMSVLDRKTVRRDLDLHHPGQHQRDPRCGKRRVDTEVLT